LSSQPEAGRPGIILRRRPTRRHLRHRRLRRALAVTVLAFAVLALASVGLSYLSPSLFRTSSRHSQGDRWAAAAANNAILAAQQRSLQQSAKRPVYPYSVVAGGVQDGHELKWAADHDPVVAAHYAGFDYAHARVVRLLLARSVYLSYRIGNRVYWTRRQVTLKKGEPLLTDGKMTARVRCANRVEEKPQQESSNEEPPVAKFDEPVMPAIGTATENPPFPLQAALERPGEVGPALPLRMYDPISGGSLTPISPPPLPSVCGVGTQKPKPTGTAIPVSGKGKVPIDVCGNGGSVGEVPEPGTWLLIVSGMGAIYWKARNRFART
jgi:hypothetical protein